MKLSFAGVYMFDYPFFFFFFFNFKTRSIYFVDFLPSMGLNPTYLKDWVGPEPNTKQRCSSSFAAQSIVHILELQSLLIVRFLFIYLLFREDSILPLLL